MAPIKEFSTADLNTISRVSSVSNTIEKINGVTVVASVAGAFLLDTYTGAQFAYALRRLATASTTLIRVRRETTGGTGDDDEADVTYDLNNEISLDSAISNASAGVTATTLGEFLNVGTVGGTTYSNSDSLTVTASCHVDTAYDQSGNGYTLDNATHSTQPTLHDGTVNTDIIRENGKPHMDFGLDYYLNRIGTALNLDQTEFGVYKLGATSAKYLTNAARAHIYGFTGTSLEIYQNPRFTLDSAPPSALMVASFNLSPTAYSGYVNGVAGDSGTGTFIPGSFISMGRNGSGFDGGWSEWICFEDQVSNHGNIESDINSEYLIYQPTDAPTSGLLATYTGAAAAYSVRQLSDKAVIAIRIRRDSDDEERNIGFDSNGDLDTTAISDFCQTANGYVTRWWDQSTNGNHADQATDTSQPQIYNGTAVITQNGKPALYFPDYTYQLADTSGAWGGTNVLTCDFVNVHTLVSGSGLGGGASSERHFLFWYDGAFQVASIYLGTYYLDWSRTTTGPTADTNQHLWYGIASNGTGQIRVDGTASTAGTLTTTRYFSGEFAFNGRPGAPTTERGVEQYQQEFIQWDLNQSASNRTGIESDIMTYFSIT